MANRISAINPPHSRDIEIRTLGVIMNLGYRNGDRVQQALLKLTADCFFSKDLRAIYEIIEDRLITGKSYDYVSMIGIVPRDIDVMWEDLAKDDFYTVVWLEDDVKVLNDYRTYRMQLQILTDAMNSGLQYGSPREALNAISEKLQRLNHCEISQQSVIRAYEAIADDFLNTPDVGSDFIQTSIEGLPEVPNRGLITIAGRSGHGKTFFAIYLMDAIIDKIPGKQSLYFNLEMSETVMLERHAKLLGYSGKNRRETIELALPQLLLKNISLVSVPMITIDEIEAHCRLAALKMPLGVVVVDYLGLIKSRSRSERKDLEQSDIAKRLAAIALSLDCIVIALIQVNREFKNRPVGERCPVVSDSAESMGSVHSSSWWLGIDRPELDSDDPEWRGLYQLRARKNRGESGLFALDFNFVDGMFSFRPKRFDQRYSGYSAGF